MNYLQRLEAAGHVLKRETDGDIDIWVLDSGYCNGPGCVNCGEAWCHHCEYDIKPCIGKEAPESNAKAYRYGQYLKLKQEFEWEDRSGGQFTQEELNRSGRDFS